MNPTAFVSRAAQAIENGQQLMLAVQHAVYQWEGSINKFLVDDKGLVILCVFGARRVCVCACVCAYV